jgi:hypothetical protein
MATFKFYGISREGYTYSLMPPPDVAGLLQQGGLFIFAAGLPTDPKPIFIEAATSIRAIAGNLGQWEAAQSHGASLLYVRFEPNEAVRQAEKEDLVAAYDPAMNRSVERDE